MRHLATALLLAFGISLASADTPFPDNKKTHWVYASMSAIHKDKLWYRENDRLAKHAVPTRYDLATKTMFLAMDAPSLIESFQKTTALASQYPDNVQTKKWAKQYSATFPVKKKLYATHLERVTKLWKFFKPEITTVAKVYKVDPNTIVKRLAIARWALQHTQIQKPVAVDEIPANRITNLQSEIAF